MTEEIDLRELLLPFFKGMGRVSRMKSESATNIADALKHLSTSPNLTLEFARKLLSELSNLFADVARYEGVIADELEEST